MMKLLCSFLTFFLLALTGSAQEANLMIQPDYPIPGEELNISYDASAASIDADLGILLVAYLINDEGTEVHEVEMKQGQNGYQASLVPDEDVQFVAMKLQEIKGNKEDDNEGNGYYTMMFTKDGKTPVRGAYSKMAQAKNGYAGYRIEPNHEAALSYIQKEFEQYPSAREDADCIMTYNSIGRQLDNEDVKGDLLDIAASFAKARKSEEKMRAALSIYQTQKMEEEAAQLEKRIRKRFPEGVLAKNEAYRAVLRSNDGPEAKEALFNKYVSIADPNDPTDEQNIGYAAASVFQSYVEAGAYDKADMYLEKARAFNYLPYIIVRALESMAGKDLESEGKDLDKAASYAAKAMELSKNAMKNSDAKPTDMSTRRWENNARGAYIQSAVILGLIHYKMGNAEQAMEDHLLARTAAKAVGEEPDLDWYGRYAAYYDELYDDEETESMLAEHIRKGKATSDMVVRYKELFMANNTLEDAFDKHLAILEEESNEILMEKMMEKMIDQEAPDFELTNLAGETVSLHDLKGKVVVLDFWATWCGPCVRSFPAMDMARAKYADNPNVVFLFVNSWENGANKAEKVSKFIEDKGYPFNVPMDVDDEVIRAYKVDGIPTKFIIDQNGRIRFKSVGFGGSNDEMVKELSAMIEAASQAGAGTAMIGN